MPHNWYIKQPAPIPIAASAITTATALGDPIPLSKRGFRVLQADCFMMVDAAAGDQKLLVSGARTAVAFVASDGSIIENSIIATPPWSSALISYFNGQNFGGPVRPIEAMLGDSIAGFNFVTMQIYAQADVKNTDAVNPHSLIISVNYEIDY